MEERKFQFSWSHFVLATVSIVFLVIVGFTISIIIYCFANELYEYGVRVLIGLFSMAGMVVTISISYYEWKSKNENQAKINSAKYDKRLSLAMKICEYLKDDRLDVQSVALLKDIISDGQTSVSVMGNGMVTAVDDTKYSSSLPKYTVDDILNEIDSTDGLG